MNKGSAIVKNVPGLLLHYDDIKDLIIQELLDIDYEHCVITQLDHIRHKANKHFSMKLDDEDFGTLVSGLLKTNALRTQALQLSYSMKAYLKPNAIVEAEVDYLEWLISRTNLKYFTFSQEWYDECVSVIEPFLTENPDHPLVQQLLNAIQPIKERMAA